MTISGLNYQFSPHYLHILRVAEDHRNEFHFGIDQLSFLRIVTQYFLNGSKQGGSTIEQQLVRTISGNYNKSLNRKFVEQLLAILISLKFNKNQISFAYLQIAYLGTNINGIFELADKLNLDVVNDSKVLALECSVRLKYPEPSMHNKLWLRKYYQRKKHINKLQKTANKLLKRKNNSWSSLRDYIQLFFSA
jgi:monofunctional glycosyltransferase